MPVDVSRSAPLPLLFALLAAACSKSPKEILVATRDSHRQAVESAIARAKAAERAVGATPDCASATLAAVPGLSFHGMEGNAEAVVFGQLGAGAVEHDLIGHTMYDRARELLDNPTDYEFSRDMEATKWLAKNFEYVEGLRYLLVVRVDAYRAAKVGYGLGMTTFDPGVMSGDATLVDLATTKVLGCVPWRMAAPLKSIPLDKSDPKKDLLIQQRALARCGVHRALVGAGAFLPFEYDCKNAE